MESKQERSDRKAAVPIYMDHDRPLYHRKEECFEERV